MVLIPIAILKDGFRFYDVEGNDLITQAKKIMKPYRKDKVINEKLFCKIQRQLIKLDTSYSLDMEQSFIDSIPNNIFNLENLDKILDLLEKHEVTEKTTEKVKEELRQKKELIGLKLGNKDKIVMADDTFALSKIPYEGCPRNYIGTLVQIIVCTNITIYKVVDSKGYSEYYTERGLYATLEEKKIQQERLEQLIERKQREQNKIAGISYWKDSKKIKVNKQIPIIYWNGIIEPSYLNDGQNVFV